jgi:hypothetical protein
MIKRNKGVKFELSVEDNNVNEICLEYMKRADHGFKKYGVTTERTDLDLMQWIQHLKEELMDATVYIHRIQKELKEKQDDLK